MGAVFEYVKPYQVYVPSFGNWGFNVASHQEIVLPMETDFPQDLKFLNDFQFKNAFTIPKDIFIGTTKINSLDNPVILTYFLEEWENWKKALVTE